MDNTAKDTVILNTLLWRPKGQTSQISTISVAKMTKMYNTFILNVLDLCCNRSNINRIIFTNSCNYFLSI